MTKEKELEPDDKEQSARFKEIAERILADDADERFDEAIKKILPPKPKETDTPLDTDD
jgi:hypothetical protein